MEKFTNPLERVRIASPCVADWNEMQGDARRRFCGECKRNVYNLSAMTKREAEALLINSEGRLCVRFYRRTDGTILTQNCPVGWAKIKQRVSRIATAVFSLVAGFLGGFAAFSQLTNITQETFEKIAVNDESQNNFGKDTRIVIETDELTDEISLEIPVTIGKLDLTAFTVAKRKR